jgi:adenylosuccinate synthase
MTALALIGGQYGSEGKGVIAAGLAHHFDAAVRTGGPNAGHSFYFKGELYKMRQVPCAWVEPGVRLFIGAGAVVNPILLEEEALRVGRAVFIDPQAALVLPSHEHDEQQRNMRALIGSTTEGVGAARTTKIARDGSAMLARDWTWDSGMVVLEPVASELNHIRQSGGLVMLEGTQGSLLSLHHGQYPYCTSHDTNAAQLAADAGLPPSVVEHTHLVVRTYPIRVNGNSGPTGADELTWDELIERGVVEQPEQTTVTQLQRRIFRFSQEDFERAIMLNDPCGVWLTFGDYLTPQVRGARDIDDLFDIPEVAQFYRRHISPTKVRLLGVGVGGQFWDVAETGDSCWRLGRHSGQQWPLQQQNHPETVTIREIGGATHELPF